MSTESAARFAAETPNHLMTVLHEDGLYRHLVFNDPAGDFYRFDLVTWPHNLMLRGDGFSFAFSIYPTADMFDLFKGSRSDGINPGYWQEKVTAGRSDVKAWSEDLFRAWVTEEAAANETRFPGALDAVATQILHSDDHSLEYRGTAEYAVASFDHGDFRLRIPDQWEQSFEDFSWEFLFACHAILWGIDVYDAARKDQQGTITAIRFDRKPAGGWLVRWRVDGKRRQCTVGSRPEALGYARYLHAEARAAVTA